MENEAPKTPSVPPSTGWRPTQSTLNGAVIGGAIAQLIVATWNSFVPGHQIGLVEAGAVNTLCVGIVGYFFADGGRS